MASPSVLRDNRDYDDRLAFVFEDNLQITGVRYEGIIDADDPL
jgi:hypothetical protein